MTRERKSLPRFLKWSSKWAGKPATFVGALLFLSLWFIIGLIWGFSDSWLLLINTIATINASLMVIIIQNTQFRESKALHLKIDELLRVNKETERELIAIEEMEEEELEELRLSLKIKKESEK